MRTVLTGDDLPDFILEAFADHRADVGRYPRALYVCRLLGEIMSARPGLWKPDTTGLWFWRCDLARWQLADVDEFGMPD